MVEEQTISNSTEQPIQTENGRKRFIEGLRKLPGRELLQKFRGLRESSVPEIKSETPFSRELKDGTRLRDLMTEEGKKHFKETVRASGGNALVVVHPYYDKFFRSSDVPEYKKKQLDTYAESLTKEVRENKEKGSVLVLFEEEYKKDELEDIITSMGASGNGNEVFIVPTKNEIDQPDKGSSPEPHNGTRLSELVAELRELGLTHATIAGMQFTEATWKSPDSEDDRYFGCAGYTLERLKESGIQTNVSEAVMD